MLGWWSTSYVLGGLLATSLSAWLIAHTGVFAAQWLPVRLHWFLLPFYYVLRFSFTSRPLIPLRNGQPRQAGSWGTILKNRDIRVISAMYFFLKMTRYTLLFWLPLYLVAGLGYTRFRAEHIASYFELFGFLGPIAVGYASQRWFSERRLALATGMLFLLAFVCLLHPMLAESGWFGVAVSISMMGILIHGADVLLSGMAVLDVMPSQLHGRAAGFVNGIGSIGQLCSPLLVTFFVSRLGWTKLFDLFVFFALLAGAIYSLGVRPKPTQPSPAGPSVFEAPDLPL